MSRSLSEEDLPELLDLLSNVVHKWEEIAVYLQLRPGIIAMIREQETSTEKKLMEIVRRWLNRVSPAPTAKDLVEVLRRRFIGEEKTALEIEKNFYLSKFPIMHALMYTLSY